MPSMALKTEERHSRLQHWRKGRPVGSVALRAGFGDIAMFKGEGPLLLHMAARAGVFGSVPLEKTGVSSPVDIVAIDANELLFVNRMVGNKGKILLYLRMTPETDVCHVLPGQLLAGALVQLVTVEATDVGQGMGA